jgi:hypothetical protein
LNTYVDTSTLLKLLIDERGTTQARAIWDDARTLSSSALTVVEARAALAAAVRNRRLTPAALQGAKVELLGYVGDLMIVDTDRALITLAGELAEEEALRGYDAVHLATALTVRVTIFTSADSALCAAAGRRGLHVANPLVGGSPA